MKKIVVDIGFANLTAELLDNDAIYPEICICLEDKVTGLVSQDIVLVRPTLNEAARETVKDSIDCIVWANSEQEDYTHKFLIKKHTEEEQ